MKDAENCAAYLARVRSDKWDRFDVAVDDFLTREIARSYNVSHSTISRLPAIGAT